MKKYQTESLEKLLDSESGSANLTKENIQKALEQATGIASPAWPLKTFVASNPLKYFEAFDFEDGMNQAKDYFKVEALPDRSFLNNAIERNLVNYNCLIQSAEKILKSYHDEFDINGSKIKMSRLVETSLIKGNKPNIKSKKLKAFINDISKQHSENIENHFKPNNHLLYRSEKLINSVNFRLIKFLEIYFDEGQALISMPNKDAGFYSAWKSLAPYDKYSKNKRKITQWLDQLPDDPLDVVQICLKSFSIREEDVEDFFKIAITSLPGWSSFISWKVNYEGNEINPITFLDYLAVRLCIKKITLIEKPNINQYQSSSHSNELSHKLITELVSNLSSQGLSDNKIFDLDYYVMRQLISNHLELRQKSGLIILSAIEETYNQTLITKLEASLDFDSRKSQKTPDSQLIFCIDVRSEPFRRSLESLGNYQTFGFAGFFGLPIKFKAFEDEHSCDSCPVLIKPELEVQEKINYQNFKEFLNRQFFYNQKKTFKKSTKELRLNTSSAFCFAESAGIFYGIRSFLKTFSPNFYKSLEKIFTNKFSNKKIYDIDFESSKHSMSLEERAHFAKQALRSIGLVENFSPLVVFCGHGSTTENNPYASALDCGACGGNHGGPNARIMAEILNDEKVRDILKQEGIKIPNSTVFVGAEHNTTNDGMELYDDGLAINRKIHKQLVMDLAKAKAKNNLERSKFLPGKSKPDTRACNWSEARPEWGLAGNASFIIAPRELSQNLNLGGRSFLHSYDYKIDKDFSILETIMTAPMIVTQWINSQYYFSSVNNVNFGSGSKITQNVFGTIAVVQGNTSDLMHGLSLQSVNSSDKEIYHLPQRIINYIYAPAEKVKQIIEKYPQVKGLVTNSWIKIVVIDPETKSFLGLSPDLEFIDQSLDSQ